MLKSLITQPLRRFVKTRIRRRRRDELQELIKAAHDGREWRKAIELEREFLAIEPENVSAMVALGIHLLEVGELQEAHDLFELAHRLDDTDMHVAVNYARCLLDGGRRNDAVANLVRAQVAIPGYPYITSNYASLMFSGGDVDKARYFSLRAWLASFDNARLPDGYIWHSAYADQPEQALAAEHHFWAHTLPPTPEKIRRLWPALSKRPPGRKLRIGYWSPDFRDHSVRYFFRPLLEGHDRDRVELILYHDVSHSDSQTEEIRARCDQFHAVYEKSDEDLVRFIASHDLDVLVELAGHTSHNRLWLLQGRLARVQITGLGYPPTTGLDTVDAKMLDPHLRTEGDEGFYSERVLVLAESFWCFDPRNDAAPTQDPPVLKAGHVTFGCFGNIAKINRRMLEAWAEILKRVPRSRLLLRAVNFQDPVTVERYEKELAAAGIPAGRYSLLGPVPGSEFFESYNDLDIVLDTHPFNGGTTTCFATYMGVPVITLAGSSLISRMGSSVVANAGAPELSVDSVQAYVRKAITLSQDVAFLKRYRNEARQRMKQGSLGDGRKFAADFEAACENLLEAREGREYVRNPDTIAPLPAQEIARRAGMVMGFGQWESAKRILAYCLKYFPDFGPAHILMTEELTREGEFGRAAAYLEERLTRFAAEDLPAVLINMVRFHLLAGDEAAAKAVLSRLNVAAHVDAQEQAQADLFHAVLNGETTVVAPVIASSVLPRVLCVIPCDDEGLYRKRVEMLSALAAGQAELSCVRCAENARLSAYESALADEGVDTVLLLQKNIELHNPEFFETIALALKDADIVGFNGARRWDRLDWRLDGFKQRCAGFTRPCAEKAPLVEIQLAGEDRDALCTRVAVLDGSLLVIRRAAGIASNFDVELDDAENLLEEVWTYQAATAGAKLAVHRGLGVHIDSAIGLPMQYLVSARLAIVEKMQFDVFSTVPNDGSYLMAPCLDATAGFRAVERFLRRAD